jgi:hypothetical protein
LPDFTNLGLAAKAMRREIRQMPKMPYRRAAGTGIFDMCVL